MREPLIEPRDPHELCKCGHERYHHGQDGCYKHVQGPMQPNRVVTITRCNCLEFVEPKKRGKKAK